MALKGNTTEEKIWNYLKSAGLNDYGAAGLMGNLYAESALNPHNLQNSGEKRLGMTDESYTAAVDNGSYKNFAGDAAGYGLAQWTYKTRKAGLLEYAKTAGKSVGDLETQLGFLLKELKEGYTAVLSALKTAASVAAASNVVLVKFEKPADQSAAVQKKRAGYGQTYFDKFAGKSAGTTTAAQTGGATTVTEKEIRKKFAAKAAGFVGTKEGSSGHHAIIDGYNAHKPLARGYKVKYTDAWCATFASYIAILMGYTDIIPTECGCDAQIALWKQKGRWVENDAYTPEAGDYIYYDWQDSGVGDNTGGADHVGIVESVSSGKITVVEGNKNNAVGRRTLNVNGRYIRGYGVPNFKSKASGTSSAPASGNGGAAGNTAANDFVVGEVVMFNGNTHYTSADAASGSKCKPGKAKITQKHSGKHPLHCVTTKEDGCTVWGWVNVSDVSKAAGSKNSTYTVKAGDSLWAIADKQLGDGSRYNEIKTLNGLKSNVINVGQVLKLPKK